MLFTYYNNHVLGRKKGDPSQGIPLQVSKRQRAEHSYLYIQSRSQDSQNIGDRVRFHWLHQYCHQRAEHIYLCL